MTERLIKEFYKKKGIQIVKPSWPDFLGYNPQTKEILFIEAKGLGDRLSVRQYKSFQILTNIGCKVEVALIVKTGEIIQLSFKDEKEKLKIPRKPLSQQLILKDENEKSMDSFLTTAKETVLLSSPKETQLRVGLYPKKDAEQHKKEKWDWFLEKKEHLEPKENKVEKQEEKEQEKKQEAMIRYLKNSKKEDNKEED